MLIRNNHIIPFKIKITAWFIFVCAGIQLGFNILHAGNHQTDHCYMHNTSVSNGEKLVFKAYYNWKFIWIPAGEAEFLFSETDDTYIITVIGKTYKSYDAFFKVRDFFQSEIDKNTMYPRRFVRFVEEGNYRRFDSLVFDQLRRKAVSFNGTSRTTTVRKNISLQDCTHDLLSVLYFLRNIDVSKYDPGEMIPTKILFDETIYPIKVRYEGKFDNFSVKGLGTFNTIKVIPDLVTGNVFKEGNLMKIWVTNDSNKLPVLIESPLAVGSAKAVLKSYSGLRYNLKKR
jgi:hypothetical protein